MKTTTQPLPSFCATMALFALALAGGNALADTTWTAGTTANWSVAADWSGGVPAGTAVLRVSVPANGNAVLATGSAYTVSLTGAGTTNDLTLNSGATLNVTSALTTTGVNETTPLGKLTLNAGSSMNLNTGGSASIGGAVTIIPAATLTINTGTTLTFSNVGANQAFDDRGTVNVYGTLSGTTNASWKGSNGLVVSSLDSTVAAMNINAGSATGDFLAVSSNQGKGNLTVSNGGTLTIRDIAASTTGIIIGNITNGNASAVTNTGAINLTNGTITNGGLTKLLKLGISYAATQAAGSGTGAVNVSGGTFNQFGTTYIGSGRNGSLNVSGTGNFTSAGDILAGGTGNQLSAAPTGSATASGAITVTGGTLTAATIKVGDGSFAVLGGANTAWSTAGSFTLSGGTVTAAGFTATNGANSTVTFNGGTLNTGGTTIANGSVFTVGNGISAAALKLNGGSHSFANGITLAANSTISGTGTITSGTLIVSSGATLSPGNSPGTLNTAGETWNGGGSYVWEINNTAGAQGTNWDFINGTGALDLSGLSPASKFNINLIGLTAGNVSGAVPNWNNALDHSWKIATFTSIAGTFSAANFNVDATGFTNNNSTAGGRIFGISNVGNDLFVTYAVPEPATWALLAFSLTTVMVLRRRHSK